MSDTITKASVFQFSKENRLQWEPSQNKHVILYPEGMVELNASSAAILQLCDGAHSLEQIVSKLEKQFGATGLYTEIAGFIAVALEKNWISIQV